MASKRTAQQFQWLARRPHPRCTETVPLMHPTSRRSMATVNDQSVESIVDDSHSPASDQPRPSDSNLTTFVEPPSKSYVQPRDTVLTTVHSFPTLEPLRFTHYPTNQLHLPLRRDLLHRAVVYEASRSRQGTANTKWRDEVHGSHKKHHPQKGLGMARAGDKQSPIRRGGGVAFGPKPRDFSMGLPRKIYDKAFRTALSHRYRRGELIIVDSFRSPRTSAPYYISQIFDANRWGNAYGRSLLVARERNEHNERLCRGVDRVGWEGRIVDTEKCDVKMLLEMGKVVLEQSALDEILRRHSKDLRNEKRVGSALMEDLRVEELPEELLEEEEIPLTMSA